MRTSLLFLACVLALPAGAQEVAGTPGTTSGVVVGVVFDSIAGAPLADATVQLVAAGEGASGAVSVRSDSLGRYMATALAPGRYLLGFLHPVLDSLGVEAPVRQVVVHASDTVRADLAVPGPARLRTSICGAGTANDSSALLVGTVRDARGGAPVAGANVSAEWMELSFTTHGVVRRMPTLDATTSESGWFALCRVPAGGTIMLLASHDADSTDRLPVELPADGFLRRDLFLGEATEIVPRDSSIAPGREAGGDSAANAATPPRPIRAQRRGEGRLRGTVVAAVGEHPLEGAQVGIADGPVTRTNERGEWMLEQLPMGSRMLEVRAVGYYPQRRPVQVTDGAPPLRVALSTMKSVLDTIRVTARLQNALSTGFAERRRSGMGHYISGKEVVARSSIFTSSVFRTVQGLRMERDTATGDTKLYQRGAFGWCTPDVYLNGHFIPGATADDIDSWVLPEKVTGIEVYDEAMIPADFQRGMTGCGAVLIWSK